MLKLKTHLDVLTLGVNREKKMFFFPLGGLTSWAFK